MSNKTKMQLVVIAVICCPALAYIATAQSESDILKFYCERSKVVGDSRDPLRHGVAFSADTRTYYKRIGEGGRVVKLDSALIKYYYSFGELDSTKIDSVSTLKKFEFDIDYPNVFATNYDFSFYPNDTGGADLAIGFDADSSFGDVPDGLAIINRSEYTLHWLYLYYPYKPDFRHYSRCYRFRTVDGFVFPDSIWVVASVRHLFSSENYRIETSIKNITIAH